MVPFGLIQNIIELIRMLNSIKLMLCIGFVAGVSN